MKKFLFILPLLATMLTSCFEDVATIDYTAWRTQNDNYLTEASAKTENGKKVFTKIVPEWATKNYVLMQWHNDTTLTAKNIVPTSTSTVNIKYELRNINGDLIDSSYSQTDSIYQSQPQNNILGMETAMVNMHVGDSVTLVVPAQAGYGINGSGSVLPFSTLVFHLKMVGVPKYDKK